MLDIIIFSKDRPAQLDLCIRSIKQNIKVPYNIKVQYEPGTFQPGYNILSREHKIELTQENDFKNTFLYLLPENGNVLCLTDDDLIINKLTEEKLKCLFDTKNKYEWQVHSISLRMNPTVNYCYPAKKSMTIPHFIETEPCLVWNWTLCEQFTCWGYPSNIDGQIFNAKDIKLMAGKLDYWNPNSLEDALLRERNKSMPLMVSLRETIVFNVQNNFVQGAMQGQGISVDDLYADYMAGERISLDCIEQARELSKKQVHGVLQYNLK
jgi:hypothetical protein